MIMSKLNVAGCIVGATCALAPVSSGLAQQQVPSKVEIAWNRFYDFDEMTDILQKLAAAYPDLLKLESIGTSVEGRDMWLVTMNNPATGPDSDKPAMWIDGNIHGNEIQATETVLYTIWYLTKSHGQVEQLTKLIDTTAFYFLPSVNPDGRANWFAHPTTPHDYRTGLRPTDNDYDGLLDEDDDDDLDGDGHIGIMWRADPNGTHKRSLKDPRILERVEYPEKGQWRFAGSEGIDNDGDGRINEDGPGGYDMNRNWPSDWQPNHVQFGAGETPLSVPETACIAKFILSHPNIAAGQAYHNAGGMILRGPGAEYLGSNYARPDIAVYDRLGEAGEEMLPFYNYWIIHADLYTVHGGFVNWLAEGLGVVSFTNELWSDSRILQKADANLDEAGQFRWQDRMLFGQTFTPWTEIDHPTLGKVLVGGGTKWSDRIPPPFMLEEECHRNFAFTMFHAEHMPRLAFDWVEVKSLGLPGSGLWQVTLEIANDRIIPSRTARAADKQIGVPDRLTLEGPGVRVLTGGPMDDRFATVLSPVRHQPWIIPVERGVPGESLRTFRFIVSGTPGASITLHYRAEKATDLSMGLKLEESDWTREEK